MAKNKYYAEQIAYAESLGVKDIEIVRPSGGHPLLTGYVNSKLVSASLGSSKLGDHCTPLNFRRDLRHEVRRARGEHVPHRHHAHMHYGWEAR